MPITLRGQVESFYNLLQSCSPDKNQHKSQIGGYLTEFLSFYLIKCGNGLFSHTNDFKIPYKLWLERAPPKPSPNELKFSGCVLGAQNYSLSFKHLRKLDFLHFHISLDHPNAQSQKNMHKCVSSVFSDKVHSAYALVHIFLLPCA